jgi:hypothetical protein
MLSGYDNAVFVVIDDLLTALVPASEVRKQGRVYQHKAIDLSLFAVLILS